ncbi:hypothetical protein HYU72_01540 [Candidatus Berkelbacteria bacterium]|nr:hypothetical protein [Candidatus Berkelbacteria bacterium]
MRRLKLTFLAVTALAILTAAGCGEGFGLWYTSEFRPKGNEVAVDLEKMTLTLFPGSVYLGGGQLEWNEGGVWRDVGWGAFSGPYESSGLNSRRYEWLRQLILLPNTRYRMIVSVFDSQNWSNRETRTYSFRTRASP